MQIHWKSVIREEEKRNLEAQWPCAGAIACDAVLDVVGLILRSAENQDQGHSSDWNYTGVSEKRICPQSLWFISREALEAHTGFFFLAKLLGGLAQLVQFLMELGCEELYGHIKRQPDAGIMILPSCDPACPVITGQDKGPGRVCGLWRSARGPTEPPIQGGWLHLLC